MDDRIERAAKAYEQAVFAGDTSALSDAGRCLDAVETLTLPWRGGGLFMPRSSTTAPSRPTLMS